MNPSSLYLKQIAGMIFSLLFFLTSAQAASFDCRKARTKIEKLICSNDELSKLDEFLSEMYLRALNRDDIKQQTIESQRQWLKYQRNACHDAVCIKSAYETRIKELDLLSSDGMVVFRYPDRNKSLQKQIRFGASAGPNVKDSKYLLSLSSSQPPRELAANSEVILISGYEPTNRNEPAVKVEVNRPGMDVLLILTSYEKIDWQVSVSPSTKITGVVTWGYKTPTVTASIPTQGFLVNLPYAYEAESINFKKLLSKLSTIFGVNKIDIFRGSYYIPSVVRISSIEIPRTDLTLVGATKFDLVDNRDAAEREGYPYPKGPLSPSSYTMYGDLSLDVDRLSILKTKLIERFGSKLEGKKILLKQFYVMEAKIRPIVKDSSGKQIFNNEPPVPTLISEINLSLDGNYFHGSVIFSLQKGFSTKSTLTQATTMVVDDLINDIEKLWEQVYRGGRGVDQAK